MPTDYKEFDAKMERDLRNLLEGKRGSPDLPSSRAIQAYKDYPTDSTIQNFLNRFGLEQAEAPGGRPPGYVPTPRPRLPYQQQGPMGPEPLEPPAAGLKTSDVMREVQGGPDAVPSDEQMLDQVRRGMGGGGDIKGQDLDEDRAALEANPTPDNAETFVEHWGPDELPPDIAKSHGYPQE